MAYIISTKMLSHHAACRCFGCRQLRITRAERACSACGQTKPVGDFGTGRAQCAACFRIKAHIRVSAPRGRFVHSRSMARRYGHSWELTQAQHAKLLEQDCRYCGQSLAPVGTGLDRVDSHLGYTPDNVVPCCPDCNRAKGASFSYEEMLVIGFAIAQVKAMRVPLLAAPGAA